MMYPFMQLPDKTEIVHSELLDNNEVKVYLETPVDYGFHSATCYLPGYRWENVDGYTNSEMNQFQKLLESVAHLILRFAKGGGFENAAEF